MPRKTKSHHELLLRTIIEVDEERDSAEARHPVKAPPTWTSQATSKGSTHHDNDNGGGSDSVAPPPEVDAGFRTSSDFLLNGNHEGS